VKNTLTQCSAAVLLPVQAGGEPRSGTAPTTTCLQWTAVPFAARLRVAAADVVGSGVVGTAPPPRGAPV
jgi:hypothetical protein